MAQSRTEAPTSALRLRLLSAAVGLPILLALIWLGGYWVAAAAAIAALIAVHELLTLLTKAGWRPLRNEGALWGAGLAGVAIIDGTSVALALGAGAVGALLAAAAIHRSAGSVGDWFYTTVGTAYVGLPLASVVLIREGDSGLEWLVIAFLGTFATDTGAFAVGRLIGRHKMAPSISPGKTWEGAFGGLLAGVGATIGLVALLEPGSVELWAGAVLGAGIGVVSQIGDLLESKVKRLADAKDSGRLIPGHGGLLDRLDSLVLVFPLIYYASKVWPAA